MQKQSPGWDYEEVDVTSFLKNEFPPGAQVDALHETEADSRWRRGIVVKQTERLLQPSPGTNPRSLSGRSSVTMTLEILGGF